MSADRQPQPAPASLDWPALDRLRAAFLDGSAGAHDYWQSERDLASYDATFAQRIGWKWDTVLAELQRRGWSPPPGDVLDWGCGSGIAGRAFLDLFGTTGIGSLHVWDRSARAMEFARRRAAAKYPGLPVQAGLPARPGTLLLSHVLTELVPAQTEALVDFARQAGCVLWVEPGTYEASFTLIAVRERLRQSFHLVAPCTHRAACGLLAPGHERNWCHHFATPPPAVYTNAFWGEFGRRAGVDLRSLPLSYLVLDQRPAPPLPADAVRVLGRPRVYKAHALLLGCDVTGVRERQLPQRHLRAEFRQLSKGKCASLQAWETEGDQIVDVREL